MEEEGKNKEKGVVFVGDFVAHHDGEWIVVVAKWRVVGLGVEQKSTEKEQRQWCVWMWQDGKQ